MKLIYSAGNLVNIEGRGGISDWKEAQEVLVGVGNILLFGLCISVHMLWLSY